jgi:methylmalonyl-CoA mutase
MHAIHMPAAATRAAGRLRFVTAAALFDGHDAAINIMRRLLQSQGAEVIHLGHNRSVEEIVTAALAEDAQGIAISSYQGGHVEYFKYIIDLLAERGASHIRVFGGGGGVIVPEEIGQLQAYGVARIFSPEDGQRLGLQGMIAQMLELCAAPALEDTTAADLAALRKGPMAQRHRPLARLITALENDAVSAAQMAQLAAWARASGVPVLGITGTGGAGKSSLTDELIRRLRLDHDDALHVAVISIDPSRRKSGGALLGDRIRMNAIGPWPNAGAELDARVYMRSMATREGGAEIAPRLPEVIAACQAAGFDLVIVETSGIGQGDAAIVPHVDVSLYVMTPEFGAASQLEKIDMLDFADVVAINKFDRRGALDALRDVARQVQRNREAWSEEPARMPVYGTQASRFNDDGVTALYHGLLPLLVSRGLTRQGQALPPGRLAPTPADMRHSAGRQAIVPPARSRYLADIADAVRGYHRHAHAQAALARERQQLIGARRMLTEAVHPGDTDHAPALDALILQRERAMDAQALALLENWPALRAQYAGATPDAAAPRRLSLSGIPVSRVALPRYHDHGELLRFLLTENLPGHFPYSAGVFPFKREGEDPTRMFAGEGDARRTNRRFKLLSAGLKAKRLSTAFDSVTLYGADPAPRPDIYGKIGNAGVSIATLDDMRALYDGFDLCDPDTSVSMTINGPAPAILAMFMNTAIDQRLARFIAEHGREPDAGEAQTLRAWVLEHVRGTVQADILKEDQGQNTCIFSTEFSLKVMGDIQHYFVAHRVRHFYSVSISGYHIAEAGANPISQLAFTLANGFTFVEAYLARGMHIDDFAPNLSFFFSNGMDPEYAVMGRVARRLWAVAMRERYGAGERSQKLKYHIQTSGRSLHAQEIDFNDIRTTLQALIAVYDNCNSLHTNAYDEAITTPTDASVRRALAIQLIINREWGLAKNENPNQGAFILDELTDLVEEAVLQEFERIAERGGVLGAMETGYQRGRIQEESMRYEQLKHDGSLPIIGVNTFRQPDADKAQVAATVPLARSSEAEKQSQLARLADFHRRHAREAPAALAALRQAVVREENVFEELMKAVRVCSLGQISDALFTVGGQYRRNM